MMHRAVCQSPISLLLHLTHSHETLQHVNSSTWGGGAHVQCGERAPSFSSWQPWSSIWRCWFSSQLPLNCSSRSWRSWTNNARTSPKTISQVKEFSVEKCSKTSQTNPRDGEMPTGSISLSGLGCPNFVLSENTHFCLYILFNKNNWLVFFVVYLQFNPSVPQEKKKMRHRYGYIS